MIGLVALIIAGVTGEMMRRRRRRGRTEATAPEH
jgi:hypothetical protein